MFVDQDLGTWSNGLADRKNRFRVEQFSVTSGLARRCLNRM